jgi:hypothetical protein
MVPRSDNSNRRAGYLGEATTEELTRDLLSAVAGRTVILITHRPVAGARSTRCSALTTAACSDRSDHPDRPGALTAPAAWQSA